MQMSETNKPNVMLEEQNIASTSEQAIVASTSESLTEQSIAEVQTAPEATEVVAEPTDNVEDASVKSVTRQEIIGRLEEIADSEDALNCKAEVENLKVQFYKLRTAEIDAARKAFVADGGEENIFIPEPDALEEPFKSAMNKIKEKRSAWLKAQEEEMQANYELKLTLLNELEELVNKAENGSPEVNEFRALQNRWKEIKNIPQDKVTPLWKQYQLLVEKFYDVLKLNHEFREYDFKKNLEIKTRLCEAAEALIDEEDVISAFRQLQQLHNEFREAGPVAPELREEVWTRFKTASTAINRRHQDHFESKKEREQQNLEQKTAICEEIEAIDMSALTTYQAWNNGTQKILELQARWKEIGFAPQKMNLKIFERFRNACDEFFRCKSEFFKSVKSTQNENLERKRALCEAAEALKDSEDWKETANKLAKLQKEWKEIGAIPQKYSDALWKRFVGACDEFFERRNKATSSQRNAEQENLKQKREIIEKIKNIDATLSGDEQIKQVNSLMPEWNAIGFVPFREKDKVYKEYKQAINAVYERLHVNANERKLADFKNNISKGNNSLTREREKLIRQYENLKAEIATYENNLGFFSTSSKKGESLVDVMRQKMEKLKGDSQVILKKIHLIEEEIEKQA
ncbi:MAG: DUF349 domain-containing protein [Bacteroidaceae bacterium]|nr:DUF349 domain-containing protein [Bacteroidaceae bacterium]